LIDRARVLRSQGLSHRAIGERLGVNGTTVGRWLKTTDTEQGTSHE
jgi:orotate phosphoribosyltransferase-like protein